MCRLRWAPLALLALSACGANPKGAINTACSELSREEVAANEPLPGGLTASDLATHVAGAHQGQLTWHGGTETGLHVTVADLGAVVRVTREPVDKSLNGEFCDDLLLAPAVVTFSTDDGAFDETAPVDLTVAEDGTSFSFNIDARKVSGSWEPGPGDMEPGETGTLSFEGTFASDGTGSGEVRLATESCDGNACGGGIGPIAAASF